MTDRRIENVRLQKSLKERINNFPGGLQKLQEDLIICETLYDSEREIEISKGLSIYIKSICTIELDLIGETLKYEERVKETMNFLNRVIVDHSCESCMFLYELIGYKLSESKRVYREEKPIKKIS